MSITGSPPMVEQAFASNVETETTISAGIPAQILLPTTWGPSCSDTRRPHQWLLGLPLPAFEVPDPEPVHARDVCPLSTKGPALASQNNRAQAAKDPQEFRY
jgi:hypothetical protein